MYFGYDPESDEIINMTTGKVYRAAGAEDQVWGDTTGLDLPRLSQPCDCDTCRSSDIPDINDIEQMAWDLLDAIHTMRRRT